VERDERELVAGRVDDSKVSRARWVGSIPRKLVARQASVITKMRRPGGARAGSFR